MVKKEILQFYNTPPEVIEVIHNGVEWTEMQTPFNHWQEKRENLLRALHLDPQAYQLLFIGHHYQRKGLKPLLQGLSLLKGAPVQLCVIGKEKKMSYFQQMAEGLGLKKSIRFLGQRSDISQLYQMADALAIPSSYDPFANVTVEALAMGLYVISSITNGGSEILEPYSGVVIEDSNNPYAIALAIEKAINTPKTAASSLRIRESVRYLDFPNQLKQIISSTIKTSRASA